MGNGITTTGELTRRLVHAICRNDSRWIRSVADEDFRAIGLLRDQYMITLDDMLDVLDTMPKALISRETYQQVVCSGDISVDTGRFTAYTDLRDRMALVDIHRITAVWRLRDEGWRLAHLHYSNEPRSMPGGERSPMSMASEAYRYLELLTAQRNRRNTRRIRDVEGKTHLMALADVVYLQAMGQSTVVHGSSDTFRVHETLGRVARQYGLDERYGYVRVHRSYLVNVLYVVSVGDELQLSTGASIPVPRRKAVELRRYLADLRSGATPPLNRLIRIWRSRIRWWRMLLLRTVGDCSHSRKGLWRA